MKSRSNAQTRSVGASPEVQPDLFEQDCRTGDIWVLCSDGLTGYVQDAEILKIAGQHAPSEAARQFIELANARGGRDNITVFVIAVRALVPGASAQDQTDQQSESTAANISQTVQKNWQAISTESLDAPVTSSGKGTLTGLRKLFGR